MAPILDERIKILNYIDVVDDFDSLKLILIERVRIYFS